MEIVVPFHLLYIRIVTCATLDLSNYILQNYSTCTKSQNCNKHKVVIHIKQYNNNFNTQYNPIQ